MDFHIVGTLRFSLILILLDCCMNAFAFTPPLDTAARGSSGTKEHSHLALVPSQVIRSSKHLSKPVGSLLIPSQVLTATRQTSETVQPEAQAETMGVRKRSKRRKRPAKKQAAITAKKNLAHSIFPLTGNLPDIYWRTVSIEHLREHPRFRPLPEPHTISKLNNLEDVRNFRQEAWQWDTLHRGRCTTSQAVAALGFLEPSVGEVLGVPPSWRRGGMGAFLRLKGKGLRTLEEMNSVLCVPVPVDGIPSVSVSSDDPPVWSEPSDDDSSASASNGTFAADYDYELSESRLKDRMAQAQKLCHNEELGKSIRMMWGNTQEATSLLTALNYFAKDDPDFILEEVGMCGAGLDLNTTQSSSLLVGATPDGVLRHSDGRLEALEVKNHCPFYTNNLNSKKKNQDGKMKRFTVGSRPLDVGKSGGVFSHYVPQLQMEMLCLGPDCKSAVMVRQTATSGALVLRMYRDDEWIEEMIYWLHRFHVEYVEKDLPPPKNFFWEAVEKEDRARYRKFVNKTKEIRNSKVELVCQIPHDEVQRSSGDSPLFLD